MRGLPPDASAERFTRHEFREVSRAMTILLPLCSASHASIAANRLHLSHRDGSIAATSTFITAAAHAFPPPASMMPLSRGAHFALLPARRPLCRFMAVTHVIAIYRRILYPISASCHLELISKYEEFSPCRPRSPPPHSSPFPARLLLSGSSRRGRHFMPLFTPASSIELLRIF